MIKDKMEQEETTQSYKENQRMLMRVFDEFGIYVK